MVRLPRSPRIADVATGTGVWALHAAKLLPKDAHFLGIDISAAQFLPDPPSNVTFTVADAKASFPSSLHGMFDMVHVRALVAALGPDEWSLVVGNLLQLLKPEGTLQWSEADVSRVRCMRSTAEYSEYTAFPLLLAKFEAVMGARLAETGRKLPEAFRNNHLANITMDWTSSDRVPSTRKKMAQLFAAGLLGWAEKTSIWPPKEFEDLRRQITEEIDNGAYIRVDGLTLIGQKSSIPT